MKNEQLMIYILIAILYGAFGFLLYKKYQSKEKYNGNCDTPCLPLTGDAYNTCCNLYLNGSSCVSGVCTSGLN